MSYTAKVLLIVFGAVSVLTILFSLGTALSEAPIVFGVIALLASPLLLIVAFFVAITKDDARPPRPTEDALIDPANPPASPLTNRDRAKAFGLAAGLLLLIGASACFSSI